MSGKLETVMFVFATYPLRTQHQGEKPKTSWHVLRIMYPNRKSCLPVESCYQQLPQKRKQGQCVGQSLICHFLLNVSW